MYNNDPVGAALQAYLLHAQEAEIIVESDITEDDVIPVSYLFRSLPEMPELEVLALAQCRGRVLDVGAGAGSHALVLQERNLDVVALDISEGAVATMQARGVKQVLQEDVFKLKGQQFDTLLLLMNGIGITGNLLGLSRFLRHAKTLLRPGGQVLLESADILYMYEDEDGSVLLDLNAGYYGEITYNMRYQNHETGKFKWLFVDAAILQDYAEAEGYNLEILYEGEDGNYLARLELR